jgi:hypothetical protein
MYASRPDLKRKYPTPAAASAAAAVFMPDLLKSEAVVKPESVLKSELAYAAFADDDDFVAAAAARAVQVSLFALIL